MNEGSIEQNDTDARRMPVYSRLQSGRALTKPRRGELKFCHETVTYPGAYRIRDRSERQGMMVAWKRKVHTIPR